MAALVAAQIWGCGDQTEPRREPPPVPGDEASAKPPIAAEEPIFGPDGELLPSGETVAGLSIPRGLTATLTEDDRRVYRTRVDGHKLRAFFGPKLLTGDVERVGQGAAYRNARVTSAPESALSLDVIIRPSSGRYRNVVDIRVLRSAPAYRDPEAVLRRYEQDLKNLD